MNYNHTNGTVELDSLPKHAANLAELTRDLATCCLIKEAQIFGEFGLTPSEGNVLLIVGREGTTSPSTIARKMGLVRSRLTALTASLVDKGFLKRTESTEDRRVRKLTLTREGRRITQKSQQSRVDFHTQLLESYPEAKRVQLISALSTLRRDLEALRLQLAETQR